jgi:uncharacterized protein YigE (DUF2233 family)
MRGFSAFTLLFLIAGCSDQNASSAAPLSSCHEQAFEDARFTVCDPGKGKLILVAAGRTEMPLRNFSDVGQRMGFDKVAFGMNAGMFGEDGRPIGLAIANGVQKHAINRRRGGGNFHLMPNGVFLVRKSGQAAVLTSDAYANSTDVVLATQSGPMLVIKGKLHPEFEDDGASRLICNGVGVRKGHALFVISNDAVSFGKFARFFRDALKTPDALFFDGSVSSLWDPANGRQDSHAPLGPMIVALKSGASAPGP